MSEISTQTERSMPVIKGRMTVMDGQTVAREINLSTFHKTQITIGREPDNDIVLTSHITSRYHAIIEIINGGLYFRDLNSTNGSFVNSKFFKLGETELEPQKMHDGDVIRIDNPDLSSTHKDSVILIFSMGKSNGEWQRFDLTGQKVVNIGRDENCQIILSHTDVSRYHAKLENQVGSWLLTDCNSTNGVYVNGERVQTALINDKDTINISSARLIFTLGVILYKSETQGIDLRLRDITKLVKSKGGKKIVLDHVNLDIDPNEFVAIIGGSGAGKTTLLNAMSGFDIATSGQVDCNGLDLYLNYSIIKNLIGYVPQQDIIFENLTLARMLKYAADMRMHDGITDAEKKERIKQVLEMVELIEHKDTYIRKLSGGQKKRASIAVELLADPGLFFLDEPTSGLDPGTEQNLMETLHNLAVSQGKTIIMVTHTTQNLHLCDKVIFMGAGGRLCFFGTPDEAMSFFETDNLVEIYHALNNNSEQWAEKYRIYREIDYYEKSSVGAPKKIDKKQFSGLRQFGVLFRRYFELIVNDTQRLLMIFVQPLLIAILLTIVASDKVFDVFEDTRSILFALSCACIWLGLFNSIQEICKERTILKREYMANLKLASYILSKFAVQLIISVLQSLILLWIFFGLVGEPDKGLLNVNSFTEVFITVVLSIFSSSALGLAISSLVKNPDRAMTVAPFVLIIQLLFSGILFELKGTTNVISYITISRWSINSLGTSANLNGLDLRLMQDIPTLVHEAEQIYHRSIFHLLSSWAVLLFFIGVCGATCVFLLRNISKDTR